jgi:hypothetical protein
VNKGVSKQSGAVQAHFQTDSGGSGRIASATARAISSSALCVSDIPDAMKILFLYLLAATAVLTSAPQDCYRIRDRDSQNSCLAMAKGEKQYCYRIQNRNAQNMCLAQVTREKQYCYRITDRDEKNRCLGLVR